MPETLPKPQSILGNTGPQDVRRSPFAHMVIEQPFDSSLYQQLEDEFPQPERFVNNLPEIASNQAIRIRALDIIDNPEFSDNWRSFFRYHTSQDFWRDIIATIGDEIRQAHPQLEDRVGSRFEDWQVKVRGATGEADVELDALFVVNTPVQRISSVRPAHVDSENEIFAGLFYMKPEGDTTPGGDLALYSFKDGKNAFGGHYADLEDVTEECVVPYGRNRFIAFVNSAESIHGVTARPVTENFRRYINFVAITPFEVFKIPKLSLINQAKFWLDRRKTKSRGINLEM